MLLKMVTNFYHTLNFENPFSGQRSCCRWEGSSWFCLQSDEAADPSGGRAATNNPSPHPEGSNQRPL